MTLKKVFGFLALAGLLFVAAPSKPAHALSLLNPAAAALVQSGDNAVATTEVRWRRYGYRRHYGFRRHYGYRRFYRPRYYGYRRYYRPRFYRFF